MPDRADQIVIADHTLAVDDQKFQYVEHLRLDGNNFAAATQLAPVTIKAEVLKPIDQGRPPEPGATNYEIPKLNLRLSQRPQSRQLVGIAALQQEDAMPIRRLMYVTVATVICAGAAPAQQREAVLQQVEVANASFNIVIATAKPGGATADYREQPDPNLVYLSAGDLVYAYTGNRQDLAADASSLRRPVAFTSSVRTWSADAGRHLCDVKRNDATRALRHGSQ